MLTIGIDATRVIKNNTGISFYGKELISQLICKPEFNNNNSWVIFCNPEGYKLFKNNCDIKNHNVRFKIIKFKHPIIREQFGVAKELFKENSIDLFHSIGYPTTLKIPKNIVFTMTAHDTSFIDISNTLNLAGKLYWNLIFPKNIKRAKLVICDSLFAKKTMAKHFPGCTTSVVPLGVDHEFYRPLSVDSKNKEYLIKKYGLPNKYCVVVGTIAPRKNLEILVSTWVNMCRKDINMGVGLVLAGGKGWKMGKSVRRWAEYINKGWLSLPGYIGLNDLPLLYNYSESVIHPSIYEGFGLTILEAMSCGVPPLVLDLEPMNCLIQEKKLLVKENTLQEWEKSSSSYLKNGYREKYSELVLKRSLEYSWFKTAKETYAEITNVL